MGFESTAYTAEALTNSEATKEALGIDTLCRHNFEHNRYIWEFENTAGIIGRKTGIIGKTFFQRRRGSFI